MMMIVITKGRLKIIGSLLMTVGTPSQTVHVYPALHSSEELRFWNQTGLSSRPACISDMTVDESFHPLEPVSSPVKWE